MARIEVGIIGGGQLGKMLAEAGIPLGCSFKFMEPGSKPPAGGLGEIIKAPYGDLACAAKLAEACAVVTVELEHVPVGTLEFLESSGRLRPSAKAIVTAQDRLLEKLMFQRLAIPCADFRKIDSLADLKKAAEELGLPLLLKTRLEGYDGKGQIKINDMKSLDGAYASLKGRGLVAEKIVNFERELSIIGVRDAAGRIFFYPLTENIHKLGILRQSFGPARKLTQSLQLKSEAISRKIMADLEYVGVLSVELFERSGELLANEIAPRVHNSGHWTMDGADASQFENHIRAIIGDPIIPPKILKPTVMLNILSALPAKSLLDRAMDLGGVVVYDYGKSAAPNRKLGHINITGETIEAAADKAVAAARILGLAAEYS